MTKSTATILSTVGHPFLLLPAVFVWLTLRHLSIEEAKPVLWAVLGCFAAMAVFLFFRKKGGKISNWDVSAQSERSRNIYRPILVLVVAVAAILHFSGQPFVGDTLFFGLLMAVCYAINAWVKISQHTIMAYYVGFLALSAHFWIGLGLLAFAPFVGWSRVVLGRHEKKEVALGTLVGVVFGLLHWWIFG
jgi:membrane-associated phospholipid phosphatase